MTKRYIVLAVVFCTLLFVSGGVAVGLLSAHDEKCPDGQQLVSVRAGGLQLNNDKPPPPGMHYSDTSDGVRVNSDRNSASGNVPLRIACR